MKKLFLALFLVVLVSGCPVKSFGPDIVKDLPVFQKKIVASDFWGRTCEATLTEGWELEEGDSSKAFKGNTKASLLTEANLGAFLKSKVLLLALESGAESLLLTESKTIQSKELYITSFRKTVEGSERGYSIFGLEKQDTFCLIAFSAPITEQNNPDIEQITASLNSPNAKSFGERKFIYNTEFGKLEFSPKHSPKILRLGEGFEQNALPETDYLLVSAGNKKGIIEFQLSENSQIPLIDFPEFLQEKIEQFKSGNSLLVSFDFSELPEYFEEMPVFLLVFNKGSSYKIKAEQEKVLEFDETTSYEISLQGKDLAVKNSFVVSSPNKANHWNLDWSLPKDSEIVSIKDSIGEIKDYSFNEEKLEFQTNFGAPRKKDQIGIEFIVKNAVTEKFPGLQQIDLPLSGKEGETQVVLSIENVLSYYTPLNYSSELTEKKLLLEGLGPPYVRVSFSTKQSPYKNFVLFGNDKFDVKIEDSLFPLVEKIAGVKKPYPKFPVVILNAEDYKNETKHSNPGVYQNGLIIIQENSFAEKFQTNKINTTLLHEAAHGLTEQVLKWSSAEKSLGWFSEGVSKYVEFVIDVKEGRIYPNLFGKEKKFNEDGGIVIFPSLSTEEELWDYFKTNAKYMENWSYSDENKLNFGYSFGELMVRNYILANGFDALPKLYSKLLEQKQEIKTIEEANKIVLDLMGVELEPCYNTDRQKFKECIAKANDLKPDIPL